MAESQTGQERTEEATPKKRSDAREKGDVVRSRELTTTMILFAAVLAVYLTAERFFAGMMTLLREGFSISRAEIFDPMISYNATMSAGVTGLSALGPYLAIVTFVAALGPVAVGGWAFNPGASAPKWNRLDPIAGLKRVFGTRGLVEMTKALAKFALILGFALGALYLQFDIVLGLGLGGAEAGLADVGRILLRTFTCSILATLLIAAIDVPYQMWEHSRKLRMTHQEIKDEVKQTDGSPEMRSHIRGLQQELANRRMMEEVPKADVVVTNPSHFAVALRFDANTMTAPRVVAKGADHVALRIREVAVAAGITILSAPPLARSIYHTTKLNREIPAGLYVAVAQVLAYVFQLQRNARRTAPKSFDALPIPTELQF
ncbi:MAG: flagellar biosynthesis protein FlhB [Proteobacteria bacterium]|nr:MAG: flagellar biosynthesis protein FlhB [Pseudomonadota bacterium]